MHMKTLSIAEYQGAEGLEALKAALLESREQGETVTVDFSAVDRIDLRWLQLLAVYVQKGNPGGLNFQGVSEAVSHQLALTGMDALLSV